MKHARYYWLLLAEGHLNPAACSAICCGGSGRYRCRPADARPECNEVRLAKKEHRCGAVSEGCPESGGSSRFHVECGFNRERRNVR